MRSTALIISRARALRKMMSEPEVMLWSRLRGRGPDRMTFRRQYPVGTIILDFYCPSCRLAVEVDGSTHGTDEAMWKDRARDHWLQTQGITVMRLSAAMVYRDLSAAVDAIMVTAAELKARPLAPSTIGSSLRSADGPPPAASRGR